MMSVSDIVRSRRHEIIQKRLQSINKTKNMSIHVDGNITTKKIAFNDFSNECSENVYEDIDVVIPFFGNNEERLQNLKTTVNYLKSINDKLNIIVVEQNSISENFIKSLNVSYMNIDIDDIKIHKTKLLNYAFVNTTSKIFVMLDADMIIHPNIIANFEYYACERMLTLPYHDIRYTTQEQKYAILNEQINYYELINTVTDIPKLRAVGGCCICYRKDIDLIGAWNESFVGWGGEDTEFAIKYTNKLDGIRHIVVDAIHVWHPTPETKNDKHNYDKNMELLKETKQSIDTYCIGPFKTIVMGSNAYKPCACQIDVASENLVSINKVPNILGAWQHQNFQKSRKNVANGIYKNCSLCPFYLSKDPDFFKSYEDIQLKYPKIASYIKTKGVGSYDEYPSIINVSHDATCNLACKSCNIKQLPQLPYELKSNMIESVNDISEHIEVIFISGMGDPFGTKSYRDWLYNFPIQKYPNLKNIELQTNGMLFTENNWNKIPDLVKDKIKTVIVSIDGASKDTFEINRKNGKWDVMLNNLSFIRDLRIKKLLNRVQVNYTYQLNNYTEMPIMVELCRKLSFDSVLFNPISNWGTYTEIEFMKINVNSPQHESYVDFCEICNDEMMKSDDILVTLIR